MRPIAGGEAADLRVGVVGGGFIARIHAAAWRRLGVRGIFVHDVHAGRATECAATVGAEVAASLDELIAAVDVVDVCTPTDQHRAAVEAAAAAGRHVICEKPIARSVPDALAMLESCRAAGVRLFVGHVVRYFPEYAAAQEAVAGGRIGRPAILRLRRESSRPSRGPESWIDDEARSGGLMLDLMIHDFDYARWIAGDVESIMAQRAAGFAVAILCHTSGALTHVTGAWGYPAPTFRTGFELAGDGGLIEYESVDQRPITRYLYPDDGTDAALGVPASPVTDDPFTVELADFATALVTGSTPRVSPDDGIAALRIALAAIESARSGRPAAIASAD